MRDSPEAVKVAVPSIVNVIDDRMEEIEVLVCVEVRETGELEMEIV